MRMGDAAQRMHVEAIPTGSISLDIALGIGGIPRGRIIEIFGAESAGKSTLCHHIVAEAQRTGGIAAYIDAEHSLDPTYAARCGVKIDDLLISQPASGEQALEIVEYMLRSGALADIIIDSVSALAPRAELGGDIGSTHDGLKARPTSQDRRELTRAPGRCVRPNHWHPISSIHTSSSRSPVEAAYLCSLRVFARLLVSV